MAAVTEYTLRRSPRARRVRVSVDGDGAVSVTLPKRAAKREADAAVRELAPWIERRRRALARAAAEVARTPGTLPYLGDELRLRPERAARACTAAATCCSSPSGDAADGARALVPARGARRRSARGSTPPWRARGHLHAG